MKNFFRTLFVSFFLFQSMSGAWSYAENVQLRPGPYVFEALPSKIYSTSNFMKAGIVNPENGDVHLIMDAVQFEPIQIVDLNLTKGTVRVVTGEGERTGPNAFCLHPNGKFYFSTIGSLGGAFQEYDVVTGTIRTIRRLAEQNSQMMIVGDDNAIYIGQSLKGVVERYDPQIGSWENLGIMDDPGSNYYRYAYYLGADSRYVYTCVRDSKRTPPWSFVVYDRGEKKQTVSFRGQTQSMELFRGVAGGWFLRCYNESKQKFDEYQLVNGVPQSIGTLPALLSLDEMRHVDSDLDNFVAAHNLEIDLSESLPYKIDSLEGTAMSRWRAKGSSAWTSVTYTVRIWEQTIKLLVDNGAPTLMGLVWGYGPLFSLNTSNNVMRILGASQRRNFDALYLPDKNLWYFVGYPAATTKYDPTRPWTLTPGNDYFEKSLNPHGLPGIAKYQYFAVRGSDGNVYVGGHHERDHVGGELSWYNPDTDVRGNLRDPFLNYDLADLQPALNKTKIIFNSASLDGSNAKMFVFDVATKRIEKEIIPLPGVSALDRIIEVSPGIIFGVAGSTAYKVDIRTSQVLYRIELGTSYSDAVIHYFKRLQLGPDGYVWLITKRKEPGVVVQISRINPANGQLQELTLPNASSIDFSNFLLKKNEAGTAYDLYTYGTTVVRRVKNILSILPSESGGSSDNNDSSNKMKDMLLNVSNVISKDNNEIRYDFILSSAEHVVAQLYSSRGEFLLDLLNADVPANQLESIKWDGLLKNGQRAASGMYAIKVKLGSKEEIKKLVIAK